MSLASLTAAAKRLIWKADWDESEHPRDDRGRFSDGGASDDISESSLLAVERSAAAWLDTLTRQERWAVQFYSGIGSGIINPSLRAGLPPDGGDSYLTDSVNNLMSGLDSALDKAVIPDTVTVYRGLKNVTIDSVSVGGTLTDKAYVSTTLNKDIAVNFSNTHTLMAITIPKGSRGAYIERVTDKKGEHEILLPRGQSFIITAVEKQGSHHVIRVVLKGSA